MIRTDLTEGHLERLRDGGAGGGSPFCRHGLVGLPATFLAKRVGLAAFHVAVSVSWCLWLGPASRQSWAIAQGDDTELQVTALMEENLT